MRPSQMLNDASAFPNSRRSSMAADSFPAPVRGRSAGVRCSSTAEERSLAPAVSTCTERRERRSPLLDPRAQHDLKRPSRPMLVVQLQIGLRDAVRVRQVVVDARSRQPVRAINCRRNRWTSLQYGVSTPQSCFTYPLLVGSPSSISRRSQASGSVKGRTSLHPLRATE